MPEFFIGKPFTQRKLGLILALLVLLTVIPRLLLAWQISSICDDGYFYLSVVEMWKQGQTDAALNYLNLNIFPFILWGLESTGLAFPWNFKIWGILISGLTVFPLFGLVRRLFNDRWATIAVLLFAMHPELVKLSVEPIRESTYWFCFILASYLLLRCATSRDNIATPIAAGLATAGAILTRTEGWTLIPLACFWLLSLAPATVSRLRQTQRIVIVLVMIPLCMFAMNLTLLAGYPHWQWGRFDRVPKIVAWMQSQASPANSPQAKTMTAATQSRPLPSHSTAGNDNSSSTPRKIDNRDDEKAIWFEFLNQFSESFEYFNLVLFIVGLTQCHRMLLSRTYAPLLMIAAAILIAVFVMLVQHQNINGRYFLSVLIITLPIQASGAIFLILFIQSIALPTTISHNQKLVVTAGFVLTVSLLFWFEALTSRHKGRVAEATLGKHLCTTFGPFEKVETDRKSGRVGFHTIGKMPNILYNTIQKKFTHPDLLILVRPVRPAHRARAHRCGLTEIPLQDLRQSEFTAFVHPSRIDQSSEPKAQPQIGGENGTPPDPSITSRPEVLR
ncbi:ArnT family glycosyltransferase [Symmachiella macrocystis]|nr:glycosyltransferase family 39 protein [Symmachiella macrocystis]